MLKENIFRSFVQGLIGKSTDLGKYLLILLNYSQ
jgi:hypothetical protein